MSKSKQVEQTVATTEVEAPAKILTMKAGMSYRGARQAWYERLVSLEGLTEKEVYEDLELNRPSVYGAKSKHCGKPEPVSGWVRFYERTGVAIWK